MSIDNLDPATTRERSPHVAIIMDGSGRWAQARGLPRMEGHRAGGAAVLRSIDAAIQLGIPLLTLFTFSTENWGRPEVEVTELMHIYEHFFRQDAPSFAVRGIRASAIGRRRDRLPDSLRAAIDNVESSIPAEAQLHVRFAIDYSGREAILEAARRFRPSSDSAEDFARLLSQLEPGGGPAPDIDLLIRTGGEQRLSNCPLWEIAYAELYFTPCLWPDFGAIEFRAAMREFSKRIRRFGRVTTVAASAPMAVNLSPSPAGDAESVPTVEGDCVTRH